ncbi:hypothetical protein JZK55_04040 [Dissulfurispira thermophila]|uniref:Uncharacterized protein n=2 Tax=root TaxID=1 RepID=A0A7G1GZI1_9BACT|nr:hypothetical protein JZK55_04040 [Dissulfurispira thermophila]
MLDVFISISDPKRKEGIKTTNMVEFLDILEELITQYHTNRFQFAILSDNGMTFSFYRIRNIRIIEN